MKYSRGFNAKWDEGDDRRSIRGVCRLGAALLAVFVLAGLGAASSWTKNKPVPGTLVKPTYLAPKLASAAKEHPNDLVRVIIQSSRGVSDAQSAFEMAGAGTLNTPEMVSGRRNVMLRKLEIVGAVAVEIRANQLERLAKLPGLTITPDDQVQATGFSSSQLWPDQSGNGGLWGIDEYHAGLLPTIAVVDSGIQCNRSDFTGRVLAQVSFATATPNSSCDGRGHGTFVAGIAAGAAYGRAGAAPGAKIVSLDVMNDAGMAWTSDVIAAANWILKYKSYYNIRVANFSLHAGTVSSFTVDPLDKAVEKLWVSGVTVVAAAGNYGDGTPSGVRYAPANDPFVITVGALDLSGTATPLDDTVAPWSAFGYTLDGFAKPEIVAAGRYMIGPVPTASTLPKERPANVVTSWYSSATMRLSGTSFAAPVVAGAVAHILALHPAYTPDQVKGALMMTARPVYRAPYLAAGVGELNAIRAATVNDPPNPNLGLNRFLVANASGGPAIFDAVSWNNVAKSDASWNNVSWNDASWNSASWNNVSWNDASWNDASWNSASWHDVSWNDVSWNDVSWNDQAVEQAAAGENIDSAGDYVLTPTEAKAVASDPDLTPLEPLP